MAPCPLACLHLHSQKQAEEAPKKKRPKFPRLYCGCITSSCREEVTVTHLHYCAVVFRWSPHFGISWDFCFVGSAPSWARPTGGAGGTGGGISCYFLSTSCLLPVYLLPTCLPPAYFLFTSCLLPVYFLLLWASPCQRLFTWQGRRLCVTALNPVTVTVGRRQGGISARRPSSEVRDPRPQTPGGAAGVPIPEVLSFSLFGTLLPKI